MTTPTFTVGAGTSQWLRVTPFRRAHPNCTDFWDGNWVDATIEVSVGAFAGRYTACLRTDELEAFQCQLSEIHKTLAGKASFASMEGWLELNIAGDGLGHFRAKCKLRDAAGIGNTLTCEFQFDQTELPAMLHSLRDIESAFPVVGKPDAPRVT
jgi:hypothetical protein